MWTNLSEDISELFLDAQEIVLKGIVAARSDKMAALDELASGRAAKGWVSRKGRGVLRPDMKTEEVATALLYADRRRREKRRSLDRLQADPVRWQHHLEVRRESARRRRGAGAEPATAVPVRSQREYMRAYRLKNAEAVREYGRVKMREYRAKSKEASNAG